MDFIKTIIEAIGFIHTDFDKGVVDVCNKILEWLK